MRQVADSRYLAAANTDIGAIPGVAGPIYHASIADQEIVVFGGQGTRQPKEEGEEKHRYFYFRRFRLLSGCRGKIQPAAVEVNRVDEVLFVAEAAGRVLHPLDLGVDGFAGGVGDAVLEVGDDR